MAVSISNGTTSITPAAKLDYTTTQASQSIMQPVIGRGDFDVSYKPTTLRSGTFTFLFLSETAVEAARQFYAATGGRFTYTSTDNGESVSITHVLNGNLVVTYTPDTNGQQWTLAVDWQEVV